MSWKASGYSKELVTCPNGEEITPLEKSVLMCLSDCHDVDHGMEQRFAKASVPDLAWWTRFSERAVRQALTELERKGVLFSHELRGRGRCNHYVFLALDPDPRLQHTLDHFECPACRDLEAKGINQLAKPARGSGFNQNSPASKPAIGSGFRGPRAEDNRHKTGTKPAAHDTAIRKVLEPKPTTESKPCAPSAPGEAIAGGMTVAGSIHQPSSFASSHGAQGDPATARVMGTDADETRAGELPQTPSPADARHVAVVDAIRRCWPKDAPWSFDAGDGAAIKRVLSKLPESAGWTGYKCGLAVAWRFLSSRSVPTEAPKRWCGALGSYGRGPIIFAYGEPKVWTQQQMLGWEREARALLGLEPAQTIAPHGTGRALPARPVRCAAHSPQNDLGNDVCRECESIWALMVGLIKPQMTTQESMNAFEMWLLPTKGWRTTGDNTLLVVVPTEDFYYIAERFGAEIDALLLTTKLDGVRFVPLVKTAQEASA